MTTLATRRRANLAGWGFSAPFTAILGLFLLVPIAASLVISITSFSIGNIQAWGTTEFVGLDNYVALLSDQKFVSAILNTAYFVVVGVPLTLISGLAVAVLLDRGI